MRQWNLTDSRYHQAACQASEVQRCLFAASRFEFRKRFLIICAIFALSFWTYTFDHHNAGASLAEWLARRQGIAPRLYVRLIFDLAALLAVLAAALRTWATAYLDPNVMLDRRFRTSRLITGGPYRRMRNPLYLGNILLAIAFGIMASRTGCVILIVGMTLFVYRLALREEAELTANLGDVYRDYCARVPRLLPSLWPRIPAAGGAPDWLGGFLGEAFLWVMAAAIVSFAVTFNQRTYFVLLACSFVVYFIASMILRYRPSR